MSVGVMRSCAPGIVTSGLLRLASVQTALERRLNGLPEALNTFTPDQEGPLAVGTAQGGVGPADSPPAWHLAHGSKLVSESGAAGCYA